MSFDQRTTSSELEKLTDSGMDLADPSQDVRGRKVLDRGGEEIGHISSLFIDVHERKVRMIEVRSGGFLGIGDRHLLLPVDAITQVTKAAVSVNATREHIANSPVYDPALVDAPTQEAWMPFYGYYGLSPYWANEYVYPELPHAREDSPLDELPAVRSRGAD